MVSDQPSVVAWVLARRGSVLGSREGFLGASAFGVGFRGAGAGVGFGPGGFLGGGLVVDGDEG